MVVQHNLRAMNSNRMLGLTQSQQAKSSEKLSSGYKINRAADDAAGLSISEKMRKQIRGLAQASLNAQDGISAVQTAEGALHEVQDMLQRMNELAVKACNGTMSETDRSYIQNEIAQLSTEIDRVAETTKFNEAYLLKGDTTVDKGYSFSYGKFAATANGSVAMNTHGATGLTATIQILATVGNATSLMQDEVNELLVSLRDQGLKITNTSDGKSVAVNAGAPGVGISETVEVELLGNVAEKYDVVRKNPANINVFTVLDKKGNELLSIEVDMQTEPDKEAKYEGIVTAGTIAALQTNNATAAYYDQHGNKLSENALANYVTISGKGAAATVVMKAGAPKVYDAVGNETTLNTKDIGMTQDMVKDLSFELHVGADGTANNKITLNIMNMSARGLGVNGLSVAGTDDTNAVAAIDTIKEAIQLISTQRSALGAVQNRLEHTINNLDNVVENTTAAESQIRDTDMASEMVKFSNNNILAQAGQAMLAQSNQANQGVLALLQ